MSRIFYPNVFYPNCKTKHTLLRLSIILWNPHYYEKLPSQWFQEGMVKKRPWRPHLRILTIRSGTQELITSTSNWHQGKLTSLLRLTFNKFFAFLYNLAIPPKNDRPPRQIKGAPISRKPRFIVRGQHILLQDWSFLCLPYGIQSFAHSVFISTWSVWQLFQYHGKDGGAIPRYRKINAFKNGYPWCVNPVEKNASTIHTSLIPLCN